MRAFLSTFARNVSILANLAAVTSCGSSPAPAIPARATLQATGNDPCNGAILEATRVDHSGDRSAAHVSFSAGTLAFTIPEAVQVTEGVADHGRTELAFTTAGAPVTTCVYLPDGSASYVFDRCRQGDDESGAALPVVAGGVVASELWLRLKGGGRSAGATTVRLVLPGPVVDDGDACTADSCDAVTGVSHLPIDSGFCRGRTNFHDRTLAGLGGNGRSCADCHMASESFQLTPAAAKARFNQMAATGVDDPLFRAIDADDFRINGSAAHDYTNLTENGLVRVTIPLPPNVKLLDCGAAIPCPASARPTSETVADVWRSVPSIFDVKITGPDGASPAWVRGPNQRGGYQLDARIDTLQNQALAALRGHAAVTADPPASFLDDIALFEQQEFSSDSVRLLSDAISAGTTSLPDPDPVLDELETAGKAVFARSCAQCHGNAGGHPGTTTPIVQGTAGTATALVRYHSVATACPRPVDTANPPRFSFAPCSASQLRNVRTYEITNSGVAPSGTPCGGAGQPPCVTRITTSDPGRLLLTGYPAPGGPGDIEHMDIPNLRGISRTAPYFSNNTAATLEEMVEHYKQFFKRVQVQAPTAPLLTTQPGVLPPVIDRPFTDAEVPALLAYLRKI